MKKRRPGTGEMNLKKPAFWYDDPQNRYNTLLICRNTLSCRVRPGASIVA